MKIDVWVPDFAGAAGGIQTFSHFLVRGLRDCFPGCEINVFAKNDTSVPPANELKIARFYSVGTWLAWQRTAAFALLLVRSAFRRKPDLIVLAHINFAPVAYWLRRLFGIPYLVVGHGVEIWKKPERRVRDALRNAVKLLAVSNYTRDRMAEVLNLSADEISVLPNTFQPDNFTPQPKPRFLLKRYGLRDDQPVILTIARLEVTEQYKGYDQVLKALVRVREKFPNVRYILGGRGPDRLRVMKLISELGLADNVSLAGYISDEELNAHYNLCDIFAMPSKGEGFGIVFLEALACGKPVIAGNKDGSVDALLGGKLGVLVDPDDVGQIANAIVTLLAKSQEQRARSQGGQRSEVGGRMSVDGDQKSEELRKRVIDAYGYQRFKERLQQLLEPLITPGSEVGSQRSEIGGKR